MFTVGQTGPWLRRTGRDAIDQPRNHGARLRRLIRPAPVAFLSCTPPGRRTGRLVGAQFPGAAVYPSSTARTIRASALIQLEDARASGGGS